MKSVAADACDEISLKVSQNEYIVEHLFGFLDVNDIKNCRLTNRTWRNIGTKVLRKKTHVLFDFSERMKKVGQPSHEAALCLENKNKMKEVSDYCQENTPENTPISSFAFRGEIECFQLINFLDDVRSYTRELEIISDIYLKQKAKMTLDISRKISPHLTKLHIDLAVHMDVTVSLCFDQMSFVKDIYLDNCVIVVATTEKRLSPSKITLGPFNEYTKSSTKVAFLVNESFDLTLAKQINLNGGSLIVDFSDCANDQVIRSVKLNNVTVRNWEKCNWKIKKFSLNGISFLDKNFIQMEELTTKYLTIDLSKIYNPASLLKLYCLGGTTVTETPFFLPNIVDVTLGCENCVAKLPYFTNNKNISKMCLQSQEDDDAAMSVNINDLPKGIKEIRLTATEVHGEGEGKYHLEQLCLEFYAIDKCSSFLAKFRPEAFSISSKSFATDEEMQSLVQLFDFRDAYDVLFIHSSHWNRTSALYNSVLSKFANGSGSSIMFLGKAAS